MSALNTESDRRILSELKELLEPAGRQVYPRGQAAPQLAGPVLPLPDHQRDAGPAQPGRARYSLLLPDQLSE